MHKLLLKARHYYHRHCAAILNWRARRASLALQKLGRRSNHHEKQAKLYEVLIGYAD